MVRIGADFPLIDYLSTAALTLKALVARYTDTARSLPYCQTSYWHRPCLAHRQWGTLDLLTYEWSSAARQTLSVADIAWPNHCWALHLYAA